MIVRSFNGTIWCRDLDIVLDQLRMTIQDAKRAGLPETDSALRTATAFVEAESGWWVILPGWGTCDKLVSEGRAANTALVSRIRSMGGSTQPPIRPEFEPTSGGVPGWVWGLGVLGGLGVLAYTTNAFVGLRRALR